ncbi:DUF6683 family protein [Inquilinus limosus]|uniref:Uncharacterized protein n=1 Tax=Inquilinus limosus MP06 TaxID=1398085 RepID=A0A0A0CZ17_9PROT|nr:DUF6683 family protein [Inquilinus limosus]KGM31070.1 hypothetical protein P409_29375 [Inquilinus limosus MP06]
MSFRTVVAACIALLAPGAAHAQYQMISPMLFEGPRISLQDHANRSSAAPADRSASPSGRQADARSFAYRPDPARRRANLARFVDRSRAADPQGAENLAALFAQGDLIERMRPELAKYGLVIDNVADAYAVWWINAWLASRGSHDDISAATAAAVRRQVVRSMASTTALATAGDAAKQEMAEALLVQGVLLGAALEQAKGDRTQTAALSRAAIQGASGMGLDLSAMTLTEAGFVPAE